MKAKRFKITGVILALVMIALTVTAFAVTAGAADGDPCVSTVDCTGVYENGFCDTCDGYQPATLVSAENYEALGLTSDHIGYYAIGNAGQLYWFAWLENTSGSGRTEYKENQGDTRVMLRDNAVLIADITVNEDVLSTVGASGFDAASTTLKVWEPISDPSLSPYLGIFDGNGHTISGLYFNDSGAGSVGLFACLSALNGEFINAYGTVKDLGIIDSYFRGESYVGSIAGDNSGVIENCYNLATVIGSGSDVGGIAGVNNGRVGNSYSIGAVSGGSSDSVGGVVGRKASGVVDNCYYLKTAASGGIGGADVTGQAEAVTSAQLSSGELAYLLGADWGQNIDNGGSKEGRPVPGGAVVYYGYTTCDEEQTAPVYSNDASASDTKPSHSYDSNDFCAGGCYLPATDSNSDGYYEIDSPGKLYWFAEQVNDGRTSIKGILTVNIVVNQNVLNEDGTPAGDGSGFREWIPIGEYYHQYTGTFDGNGKTVSGLYFNNTGSDYVGLFGRISGGTVKNVGVIDSYFRGKSDVGGIAGTNTGTVDGCYSEATVSAGASMDDENLGGVVGNNSGTVKNSSNAGTVKSNASAVESVGGVVGYNNGGTVDSCNNTGDVICTATDSNVYSEGIGGVVGNNYEGTVKNSQNTGDVICTGKMISSVGGVIGYTGGASDYGIVDNCSNEGAVSCTTSSTNHYIGGVVGESEGTDINNCHNSGSVTGESNVGGVVGAVFRGGIIESCYNTSTGSVTGESKIGGVAGYSNGTVTGSYNEGQIKIEGTTYDSQRGGGVVGDLQGTVQQCYNTGDVIGGKFYAGGIVGYITRGTIEYSYNLGDVTGGDSSGGVVGRVEGGTVRRCYSIGTVSGSRFGGVAGTNVGTVDDCYYLSGSAAGGSNSVDVAGKAEARSAEEFASGEVTYALNGGGSTPFYQTVGEGYPTFDPGKGIVYRSVGCTSKYSNEANFRVEHIFSDSSNGFCTECDEGYQPATRNDNGTASISDDYYEIDNAGNLYWFSEQVGTAGLNGIKALLTDDIVVNEGVLNADGTLGGVASDFRKWIPIGYYDAANLDTIGESYEGTSYDGIFDGNGHTISGLYYDVTGAFRIGMFVTLGDSAVVKNLGVIDSYFGGEQHVGGIAGFNKGEIYNCYSEATVVGAQSVGGIAGSSVNYVFNCYNAGSVSGEQNVGGIVGNGLGGTVEACYSIGSVACEQHVGGVTGTNAATVVDCYYLSGSAAGGIDGADAAGKAEAKSAEAFASGEVAYLLGEGWGQLIGTDGYPTFATEGNTVYQILYCDDLTYLYSNVEYDETVHKNNGYGYCEDHHVEITGASIALGSDLTVNYYVALHDESIVGEGERLAIRFTMNGQSVLVYANAELVNGEYVFAFKAIAPQQMADLIDATLMTVDSKGDTVSLLAGKEGYSVKANAEELIALYPEDEALVQLIVDMLTYGTAAQNYKDYNSENPANAGLPGNLAPSSDNPESIKAVTIHGAELGELYFTGATVWFDRVNRIGIMLSTVENARLVVKIGDDTVGKTYENLTSTVFYTDPIYATEFDTPYTFELYEGETLVQSVVYSVSSYAHAMMELAQNADDISDEMAALALALYRYGESAKAYAASPRTTLVSTAEELQTALNAGGRVKLVGDIDLGSGELSMTESVSTLLMLNGHTITSSGARTLRVENDSTLTVTDGVGGGSIVNTDGSAVECDGALTLESGEIRGAQYAIHNYGELYLNGGRVVGELYAVSNYSNCYENGTEIVGGIYDPNEELPLM